MMRATRNALMIGFALMLASCTPPEIQISIGRVSGLNVVTLTQDWGIIFSRKKPPCLDRIELRRVGTDEKRGREVWLAEAKTEACVDVDRFVLGVVPSGFREVMPMTPQPRGRFELAVWGVGAGWKQFAL
jgi:hypothetical protein